MLTCCCPWAAYALRRGVEGGEWLDIVELVPLRGNPIPRVPLEKRNCQADSQDVEL